MQLSRKILFYFLVFLLSCKKDEVKLDYPSSYHKTQKEISAVRVFTSKGELKQSAIINHYATLDSNWFVYYREQLDSVKLIDQQNAIMIEGYSSTKCNYVVNGRDLRFSSKDTFGFYSAGDIFTKTINYYAGQFKPPVYNESIVSSTAGNYLFSYLCRKEYYLTIGNDRLKAPWILAAVHTHNFSPQFAIQNKLDRNFYKFIASSDTVVIQEFFTWYEK
jgi:hypothetical protein